MVIEINKNTKRDRHRALNIYLCFVHGARVSWKRNSPFWLVARGWAASTWLASLDTARPVRYNIDTRTSNNIKSAQWRRREGHAFFSLSLSSFITLLPGDCPSVDDDDVLILSFFLQYNLGVRRRRRGRGGGVLLFSRLVIPFDWSFWLFRLRLREIYTHTHAPGLLLRLL